MYESFFCAWRSLLEACRDGDGEALTLLLDGGADVNQVLVRAVVPVCSRGPVGTECSVPLCLWGAGLEQANRMTPLFLASTTGHEGLVAILVEHGADVNQGTVRDRNGPCA